MKQPPLVTRMSLLELFVFLDPQLLYVVAAFFSVTVVFAVLFATRQPSHRRLALRRQRCAMFPAIAILVLRRRRRSALCSDNFRMPC